MTPKKVSYRISRDRGMWWARETEISPQRTPEFNRANFRLALDSFLSFYPNVEATKRIGAAPLDWYWHRLIAAYPSLHTEEEQTVEIRISQIAESVLVSVLKDNRLIMPPVFCSVERLNRDDQLRVYRHFFSSEVVDEVSRIKRATKKGSRQHRELSYVLGRHDVSYLMRHTARKSGIRTEENGDFTIHVEPRFSVHPFVEYRELHGGEKLELQFPWHIVSVPASLSLVDGDYKEGDRRRDFAKPQRVLLSSRAVRSAMENISEVWNDPTANSVLLVAPPGSGKEVLVEVLFRGKKLEGEFLSLSLAQMSFEETSRVLFGSADDQPGFVERSAGGLLFIDEVDKANEASRSMLLRVLENDRFIVPGTSREVRVGAAGKKPLYVFAGSMPKSDMFSCGPIDFWTRISHVIEMGHFLYADSLVGRRTVAEDYFALFWLQHVPKFFEKSDLLPDKAYNDLAIITIHAHFGGALRVLVDEEVVRSIVRVFSVHFCGSDGKLASVRNIRSVVARMAFEMIEMVLYDKDPRVSWRQLIPADVEGFEGLRELFLQGRRKNARSAEAKRRFDEGINRIMVGCIRRVV